MGYVGYLKLQELKTETKYVVKKTFVFKKTTVANEVSF